MNFELLGRELAERTRLAQELEAKITDPGTLERVAQLLKKEDLPFDERPSSKKLRTVRGTA